MRFLLRCVQACFLPPGPDPGDPRKDKAMDIRFAREDNILIASVSGRIDGVSAREFAEAVDGSSLQGDRAMILYLDEVDYINSVGLQAIFAMAKRSEAGNSEFALCSLSEQVMTVFEVCGFAKIIPIFPDRAGALASVKS